LFSENMNYVRNNSRLLFVIWIGGVLLFSIGCSIKPSAIGEVNQIIVLADEQDWNYAASELKAVYERIIETPQFEKSYTVNHPPLEGFEFYQKYHNVILLGTLESGGIIGKLLNNNITPKDRLSIEAGTKFAFQQRDVWARNQYLLILVAPTIQELIGEINAKGDLLYQLVDNEADKFLKSEMYKRKEKVEISKQLFEKYRFTFRVQHDYFLKEWPEHNTVFFRRNEPDRMIAIHWIDTTDVGYIPEYWVIQKRNDLGEKLLDGRVINVEKISFTRTEFADYTALRFQGLWWHPVKYIGGPMINYTFYDERTSRIYMIDLSVFAPEYISEKEPFLRQLNIIANTFTTNPRNLPYQE